MADLSKAALNIWCGKKKLKITYDVGFDGKENQFRCEITIDSITYTAVGIGQNKKSASNQAALCMLAWLVNGKYLTKTDLSEPCYTSLKIHEVLFPGGLPIKLTDCHKWLPSGSVSNGSNSASSATPKTPNSVQASSSSASKQDWWDMNNGNGFDYLNDQEPPAQPPEPSQPVPAYLRTSPRNTYRQAPRPGPYPPQRYNERPRDYPPPDGYYGNGSEFQQGPPRPIHEISPFERYDFDGNPIIQSNTDVYCGIPPGPFFGSPPEHRRQHLSSPPESFLGPPAGLLGPPPFAHGPPPPDVCGPPGPNAFGLSSDVFGLLPHDLYGPPRLEPDGYGPPPPFQQAPPADDPYNPVFWNRPRFRGDDFDERHFTGPPLNKEPQPPAPKDVYEQNRIAENAQQQNQLESAQHVEEESALLRDKEIPIENAVPMEQHHTPQYQHQTQQAQAPQHDIRTRKTLDYSKPTFQETTTPAIGNFNMDNAKQQLHQFMQVQRIKADYEYDSVGPAHAKRFTAKLKLYIRNLHREICNTAEGASKMDASRNCALQILRQLYSEGLIEEFQPDAPSKRQLWKMNLIYEITVTPYLRNTMMTTYNMIQTYNQCVNPGTSDAVYAPGLNTYFNPLAMAKMNETGKDFQAPNYLYWCAPLPHFNPWTNTKPDDAIFPNMSPEEVNVYLQDQFQQMVKNPKFQSVLVTRMKLPIYCIKEQVIDLISNHSVLIIKGSTGCGKTTQVPQFILDSFLKQGNGANCSIVVTQPRRISAISISERVAFERNEVLSPGKSSVGYSVRFDRLFPRPYGSILFCTTGHLLRRIQGGLKGISHLIIDEVHERDINTDLLLVIVRDLIRMGLELKVVIMSATIGVQRFQQYFNNCHVLEIDGSLFPVQRYFIEDTIEIIKWRPQKLSYLEDDKDVIAASLANNDEEGGVQQEDMLMVYENNKISYSQQTIDLMKKMREGVICFELILAILEYIDNMYVTGAVLIFLPGWTAIFELLNFLKSHPIFGNESKFLLLPLHSQLAYKDNHRVFQKVSQRKIILSTNIAETSITIDDVVFVVDTCLLKRKVYCSKTNVTSYIVDWVSKSNIQQRQGRAGRVRSGYFFALCSKKRYEALEDFKIPEILVTSLVETCLLIKYLGFGNVPDFLSKCLDRPTPRSVQEALAILRSINAFDEHDALTPLGTILVKLPIDPRLGRMVVLAILLGVASPALTIAAASATQHELFDSATNLEAVSRSLIRLDENRISDHLIQFKVFHLFEKQGNLHEYRDCLNMNAVFQVQNARKQLSDILVRCGFPAEAFNSKPTYSPYEMDAVIGLLVTAFYPNVCLHKDTRRILTNEEKIGLIHKSSVLYAYINEGRINKTTSLKSPLFVYSEKSANRNLISSKHMTMVTFLQLMLFGIRRYEFPIPPPGAATDTILLDGWLEVRVDPQVFDCVWLIKTELENILTRICYHPATLGSLSHIENSILDAVRNMCAVDNVSVEIRVNTAKPPLLNG